MFGKFFPPRKSRRLRDNVKKYGGAREATDDNIIRRMRFACWITKTADTLRIYNTPVLKVPVLKVYKFIT